MLVDETILCFTPDPWAGLWRNRHQIMTRLGRRNTVLYIEPRLYLWETFRRFGKGSLRLSDLRRPLAEHYRDGLWVYHDPYFAPFSGRLSGGPLTAAVRRRTLRRTLRCLGASAPILWLVRPYMADQIGQYGEKLIVYHVTDEYAAYPIVTDRQAFERQEKVLLRRADLVIVTSPGLLVNRAAVNPHTYLVPNAVDYQGFAKALRQEGRQPEPLPWPKARPYIGYVGALNEKVDYKLLAKIARICQDWQLVLIGELNLSSQPDKADALRGLPNVHWLGRVRVEQLPRAIAALDVCLLPYELNDWTANLDSLKLYEYLACGRPVVSTDIAAARRFGEWVRIAASAEEFIAHIGHALAEGDPALVERRKAVAAANTWDDRVERIEGLLTEALARRRRNERP